MLKSRRRDDFDVEKDYMHHVQLTVAGSDILKILELVLS